MLDEAKITTLERLKAVADRVDQLVPGIGPKMAEAIRLELARIAASDRQMKPSRFSDSYVAEALDGA